MGQSQDYLQSQAREEALAWFVRLSSGEATAQEHAAHAAWLDASAVNRQEYEKLSGLWHDVGRIPDPRQGSRPAAVTSHMLSRRGLLTGGAMAAAAVGYVAVAGLPDFLLADYATGIGKVSRFTLPDGSKTDLDADSALKLDFTAKERRLHLLRGRAYFDVAKDQERPFTVVARSGSVTALGTRFVVHEWDDEVTVAVEENAVAIEGPGSQQAELRAGEYVSYGERGLGAVASGDTATESAWRRGKLIFEDRPLRQVIADVNRYRSGTILILDDDLLELRVSGIFDISNPDGVLHVITHTLPVNSYELTPFLVLLRAA
ncbi:MAG: FecR family protein [Methyloligella sp. ZOD6]